MEYAYEMRLYGFDGIEICSMKFDTFREIDEEISNIFECGQQNDCYYKLTDWLGNYKIGQFTTMESFWTDLFEYFYY